MKMVKKRRSKAEIENIRQWIFRVFYFVGLFLAVIGSYQVYSKETVEPWKLASNILYSTMKLFLFAPTASIKPSGSLAYELAIWICPIGTVLGFFQVFKPYLIHVRQAIFHWNQEHTIIIGNNPNSLQFVKTMIKEYPKERLILLVESQKEKMDMAYMEEDGIRVLYMDFDSKESPRNEKLVYSYLRKAKIAISFEDDPINFTHLEYINSMLAGIIDGPIKLHMMSGSTKFKEMIEETTTNWSSFDVHFFDLNSLRAIQLLEYTDFRLYETKGLREPWEESDIKSEIAISNKIGRGHLLIIGFGQTGRAILKHAINQGCLNPFQRFMVTIIDKDGSDTLEIFERDMDQREKVVDINLLDMDLRSNSVRTQLGKLKKENPINGVVYCLEDGYQSMISIERLKNYYGDAQIAVYAGGKTDIDPLINLYDKMERKIIPFGENKHILRPEIIINESQLERAKNFNQSYNNTLSEILGFDKDNRTKEEQWEGLTTLAKESNMAQTLHRRSKYAIVKQIAPLITKNGTVEEVLKQWREKIEGNSISRQVDIIEKDPIMNYITQLEHLRWNNFHYVRNFVYGNKKDLSNKKHDCLIDSWEEFMAGPQRDKAIYDFLSVLEVDKKIDKKEIV